MRRVTLGPGGQGPLQERLVSPPPAPPAPAPIAAGGPPAPPWSAPESPDVPEPAQDWDYTPLPPAEPPGNGESEPLEPPEPDLPPLVWEEPQEPPEDIPLDHPEPPPAPEGDLEGVEDACDVSEQGRKIEAEGVRWLLDGLIPDYGMLGFIVGAAKTGKTTFGQALGDAVSKGEPFIGHASRRVRVLYIAAEDPPEYTAWVARRLIPTPGMMYFYRKPIILNDEGLDKICRMVKAGGFGLVLIASWQAVIRGLVRDENDNSGAVVVVERVKIATRRTVPWLIDAHAGKKESQSNEADPASALRGASAAGGAADFMLWLRYGDGVFGSKRRLSGKGRFVSFAPQLIDYDPTKGTYVDLGLVKGRGGQRADEKATELWQEIQEKHILTSASVTLYEIMQALGMWHKGETPSGSAQRRVRRAVEGREEVISDQEMRHGRLTTIYRLR
jgi:hypothetical protein